LIHSMRLSLMKGAQADLSSTAWQEIGVKPGFGGIPQHSTLFFCHPDRSGGICSESLWLIGGTSSSVSRPAQLQIPPALRSGRDDKLEGGGPPWHKWRGMDRSGTTATNPVPFARVPFNAFSKLGRPKGRSLANLDSSDFQPSPFDKLRAGSAGLSSDLWFSGRHFIP
jgi:hypothetical protein